MEAIVAHLLNQLPDNVADWFFPRALVEALWLPSFDFVFLPNIEIMLNDGGEQLFEVGPSVHADLQNDFVHGLRQ